MKLEQVPIKEIAISDNIVRFSTPIIFETAEIKQLVQSCFETYQKLINPEIQSLGKCITEANAQSYPFNQRNASPVFFNIVFDLTQTNFSFQTTDTEEALKLFRLLRDQRQIVPDIKTIQTLKGTFSEIISAILWQIGAIKVSLGDIKPYFKVDERKNYSPLYIDIKILPAYPTVFDFIVATSMLVLENLDFDLVCGIEAGSITLASLIAHKLSKPMFFARREKRYPEAKLLEGINSAQLLHKNVLVVDDTIVAGWTKTKVFEEIRALGGKVDKCFVVFDRQQNSEATLKAQGVTLYSLTNIQSALSDAIPKSITYLTDAEHREIREYFRSPKEWHRQKGFEYYELKPH
ncbi:MAG: phosphoribosyltransferase family protein [candidate division WOR-3 bacterium]|nr:phosphoribosyltransferase family protein [candidate division WOR-3 bacterium]